METITVGGVTLIGGNCGRVSFGFTERGGGVSREPYASLNLGSHVGDDPVAVEENRRRALAALGCGEFADRLLVPNQIHGDRVVSVTSDVPADIEAVKRCIAEGADAICCTAPGVPVMLCYADCVPVVLTCENGFAVVHSGWKGTLARIAAKAAVELARIAGVPTSALSAHIGPHICGEEYEVSPELLLTFSKEFDNIYPAAGRTLDLSACIRQSLEEVGVFPCEIYDPHLSTVQQNDRFFSYRVEQGVCGRHAAMACLG